MDSWYNHGYTREVKTAISIPDSLFEAAERLAERLGLTRSGLYAKAVAEFVAANRESQVQQALDEIYREEDSRLDPSWMKAQAEATPTEDW